MRNLVLAVTLLFCLSGSACADLILHYQADNSSIDSSGYGHDGTLFNGATYAAGQLGEAFLFDGVNDYLAGPVVPQINPNSFSIALWVKAVPESGLHLLADSSHGGSRGGSINWEGFALQLNGGVADFAFGNGSTFPHVTSNTVVADNTFHHLAATFDGSLMSIYVDGDLDNTASFSGTPMVSGRPFRLGNHDQLTGRALNGLLDDVRLYDEVLTAGQVQGLANVPEPASGTIFGITLAVLALVRRRHPRDV